jgi:hypothetical protein
MFKLQLFFFFIFSAKDKQVLENCLTAINETIFTIYKNLKVLEACYKIPHDYESAYQPFENIEDCEILKTNVTDLVLNNIKVHTFSIFFSQ